MNDFARYTARWALRRGPPEIRSYKKVNVALDSIDFTPLFRQDYGRIQGRPVRTFYLATLFRSVLVLLSFIAPFASTSRWEIPVTPQEPSQRLRDHAAEHDADHCG